MKMALLSLSSSSTPTLSPLPSSKPHHNLTHKPYLLPLPRNTHLSISPLRVSASDNGAGVTAVVTEEKVLETPSQEKGTGSDSADSASTPKSVKNEEDVTPVKAANEEVVKKFSDPRWVKGTWDLKQFLGKDGITTDWDAVIDAGNFSLFLLIPNFSFC